MKKQRKHYAVTRRRVFRRPREIDASEGRIPRPESKIRMRSRENHSLRKADVSLCRARLSQPEQRSFFAYGRHGVAGRSRGLARRHRPVQFLLENGFTTGSVVDVDGGQR